MPYRWQDETAHSGPALEDTPHGNAARNRGRLVIWPHRSLPAAGFAWVIGLAAAGLALPILSMLGRAVLWGLLPFAGIAVGAVASYGAVSLPGQISFFSSIAPIAFAMGVPVAPLAILIAVETIPDIFRTLGNVTFDVAVTSAVDREKDAKA